MPATIVDIARTLNLSHTTVSKILNGRNDQSIPEATKQRVRQTAGELGYRPHRAARALVTGRSQQVALWMEYIGTPYDAQVVRAMAQQIQPSSYEALIAYVLSDNESATPMARGGAVVQALSHVDGCLAFECLSHVLASLGGREASRPPLVGMGANDYRLPELPELDYVGIDLGVGVEEAVRHLQEIGCRRIAFLGGGEGERWAGDRRRPAYTTAQAAAGLPRECIDTNSLKRAETRAVLREYIAAHGCPDALVCFNDEVALGAYRSLYDLGLRIPEDVCIVGCDGIEDVEYLEHPLSTLIQPVEQMCLLAWQYLLNRMENPALPPQQTMLQPRLVVRESSLRQ